MNQQNEHSDNNYKIQHNKTSLIKHRTV